MTNEELAEQIQQGINVKENLGVIYEQNKGFLYSLIRPFLKYAEADDLMQEAYIGLHEAVMSYTPGETKLTTYAVWKIRKECIRYIQGNETKRIPVNLKQDIFRYNKFVNEYVADQGEEPDDSLICLKLQMNQKKLDRIRKALYEQNCISIHSSVPGTEDTALENILADPSCMEEEVEEKMFHEHERKVLDNAVSELPPRHEQIIRCKYFDGLKHSEIADQLCISQNRVAQLQREALQKLRLMDKLKKLCGEKYGYDSQLGYHASRKYCLDNRTSPTEILAMKRIEFEEKQNRIQQNIDDIFAELLEG